MNHLNAFIFALPLALLGGCATAPSAPDPGALEAPSAKNDILTGDGAVIAPRPCGSAGLFAKYGFMADVRAAFGIIATAEDYSADVRLGKVFVGSMGYGGENVRLRLTAGSASLSDIWSGAGTDGVLSFEFGGFKATADNTVAKQIFNAMTGVVEVREVRADVTTRTSPAGRLRCEHLISASSRGAQFNCTIRDIVKASLAPLSPSECIRIYP